MPWLDALGSIPAAAQALGGAPAAPGSAPGT